MHFTNSASVMLPVQLHELKGFLCLVLTIDNYYKLYCIIMYNNYGEAEGFITAEDTEHWSHIRYIDCILYDRSIILQLVQTCPPFCLRACAM